MATIYSFRTGTYSRNIYLYGNTKFEEIDQNYIESAKQYGANNFTNEQIGYALSQGWITQQEYDDTMTYNRVLNVKVGQ
ncbi:hypothetical protein AB1283_04255 [Bacillus sp. S13(2024)]|uniref:hypothetical protein n=1 Tax=unclassified Bacillus (in: firmicutes) TaxID=185979 RepID=UPI003D1F99A2